MMSETETTQIEVHNRDVLANAGSISVVFEGDSVAKMYIGNESDYETMMME
jgi:hypothetical protein